MVKIVLKLNIFTSDNVHITTYIIYNIAFSFSFRTDITQYDYKYSMKFNHRRLAKEGLVNLTEDTGHKLGSPVPCARCYPLTYGPQC